MSRHIRFSIAALLSIYVMSMGCDDQGPSLSSDGFSIHLATPGFEAVDLRDGLVDLADIETEQSPVITLNDIHWYDWNDSEIRVADRVADQEHGQPFVLTAMGERIYAGVFWAAASSESIGLITMSQVLTEDGSSLIWIGCHGCADSDDLRYDPRIRQVLEAAGKLR